MTQLTAREARAVFRKAGYTIYTTYGNAAKAAKRRGGRNTIMNIAPGSWIVKKG